MKFLLNKDILFQYLDKKLAMQWKFNHLIFIIFQIKNTTFISRPINTFIFLIYN